MESHTEFQDRIKERTIDLTDNWWPFIQNVEDIMSRMNEIEQMVSDMDNRVGEAYGLRNQ